MPPARGKGKGIEFLLAHVKYSGDDCLAWPFAKDSRVGRGMLGYNGRIWWAHRLMCVLAHGEPPTPKHQTAHSCGNGHNGCVNPRHLSWKTNSENQKDRRKHGTQASNLWGNKGRLTTEQTEKIRALKGKKTQVAIAAEFGVSLGCVQYWHSVRDKRRAA